jgi:hypothetical protein
MARLHHTTRPLAFLSPFLFGSAVSLVTGESGFFFLGAALMCVGIELGYRDPRRPTIMLVFALALALIGIGRLASSEVAQLHGSILTLAWLPVASWYHYAASRRSS